MTASMRDVLPSVRDPQRFWDVFGVVLGYVVVLWIVLHLSNSPIVRAETVLGTALVCVWTMWAIRRILDRAARSGLR